MIKAEELEGDPRAALIIVGNELQHVPSKTKNQFRGQMVDCRAPPVSR